MQSWKFIPAKFLKGTIRESLYPRKIILALGDRESLSPPAKVHTIEVINQSINANEETFPEIDESIWKKNYLLCLDKGTSSVELQGKHNPEYQGFIH